MKTLTSSCRPSWTSSTHFIPLALYHVIWRQPSSNLCWKSHHLTKIFLKTTIPFLSKILEKVVFHKLLSRLPRKQPQQSLSVSLSSRTQHWNCFAMYCKRYSFHSGQWQYFCSFVGSFCCFWYYWPPNSLPPELFLMFSLLHSSGFTHLSDRYQSTSVNNLSSSPSQLMYGVPQGSVLGPNLFVLYTTLLSDIIANHSVNHQLFADDTQLQKSTPLSEVTILTKELNACTDDIKTWMTENQLKLNDDKTEALLFPIWSSLKPTVSLPDSITLGSHNIPFSDSARNLGFVLDSKLSMKKHVIKICQTAYFKLKCISSVHSFLTEDATKALVTSYILSRLDYCNCLLMGTPNSPENSELCCKTCSLGTPSPLLEKLHWLPISECIEYKVACMCFSTINGSGPAYLSELLHVYTPSRTLCSSSDTHMLEIQQHKRKTHGFRTFSCFRPHIWNSLPQDLRHCSTLSSFKAKLKTFLFSQYFHPN